MTEIPIPASDWSPGTLRTHKIGRARRGPIWGARGWGSLQQPKLYLPARAAHDESGPRNFTGWSTRFSIFCFLWVLWRFQVATHNPRSRPVGYATPEVPRALRLRSDCDLVAPGRCHGACTPGGTPGGTPGPGYASTHAVALPRSLFWQAPPGCGPGLLSRKRRFWDLATSSTGFEYTRAVRDPRSGELGQGRPSPDLTWPPTHSLCGRAV